MQAAQRTRFNHALEFALDRAADLALPPLVAFGLDERYPEANARHFAFLLEGLADVRDALRRRGIAFVVRRGRPPDVALDLAREAAFLVTDAGYLRHQRAWRRELADAAPCPVVQVETEAVVPVETALPREAWSAAVLRPRIARLLPRFLVPLRPRAAPAHVLPGDPPGLDVGDPAALLATLDVDRGVAPVDDALGGEEAAHDVLEEFLARGLSRYADRRGDPAVDGGSRLGAHLHFGHLAALEVALAARGRHGTGPEALVEQLVVRRELSFNFCRFNDRYDTFEALPDWARRTLLAHADDPRPALYTPDQLERAETDDPYWNAAQREMLRTGSMHNTLRMYWGKKILEWTARPEEAFARALALNNRWQLDGRDPNSFAGVAWVFGKHDRPWGERPVFGTVRSMTAGGLRRKYSMDEYVARFP